MVGLCGFLHIFHWVLGYVEVAHFLVCFVSGGWGGGNVWYEI